MFEELQKPKLVPVTVPWQVSPSAPSLRLEASESESAEPTTVRFLAHFGLEEDDGTEIGVEIMRVVRVSPENPRGESKGPYKWVRIVFSEIHQVKFAHSYSDSEVVKESDYDWTAVFGTDGSDLQEELDQFWESWKSSGLCPDPGVYEVLKDEHDHDSCCESRLKHLMVLGHDVYIEAWAKDWSWEICDL